MNQRNHGLNLRSLVRSGARSSELSVSVKIIKGAKFESPLKMDLKELHEQHLISYWTVNEWESLNDLLENVAFLAEQVNVRQDVFVRPLEA